MSPHSEIASFGAAIEYLLGAAGGVASRAAGLAGVPPSTFRGWLHGRQPKAERAGQMFTAALRAQRRARLPKGRERRLRNSDMSGVTVMGTFRYAGGGSMRGAEDREVDLGSYMDNVADDLVDAFLDGASTDELAAIFHEGINDGGFYEQTFDPGNPDGGWDIDDISGWG